VGCPQLAASTDRRFSSFDQWISLIIVDDGASRFGFATMDWAKNLMRKRSPDLDDGLIPDSGTSTDEALASGQKRRIGTKRLPGGLRPARLADAGRRSAVGRPQTLGLGGWARCGRTRVERRSIGSRAVGANDH
jgi:hypothetical protein